MWQRIEKDGKKFNRNWRVSEKIMRNANSGWNATGGKCLGS